MTRASLIAKLRWHHSKTKQTWECWSRWSRWIVAGHRGRDDWWPRPLAFQEPTSMGFHGGKTAFWWKRGWFSIKGRLVSWWNVCFCCNWVLDLWKNWFFSWNKKMRDDYVTHFHMSYLNENTNCQKQHLTRPVAVSRGSIIPQRVRSERSMLHTSEDRTVIGLVPTM